MYVVAGNLKQDKNSIVKMGPTGISRPPIDIKSFPQSQDRGPLDSSPAMIGRWETSVMESCGRFG